MQISLGMTLEAQGSWKSGNIFPDAYWFSFRLCPRVKAIRPIYVKFTDLSDRLRLASGGDASAGHGWSQVPNSQ